MRVRRDGVTAVARECYYVAPGEEKDAAASRALRSAFDATGLPLRVHSEPATALEAGKIGVALSIGLAAGGGASRLRVQLAGRRLEGHETIEGATDLVLEPPERTASLLLRLEPGTWQVRVVATDAGAGALGSVLHTFEVPAGQP